VEKILPFSKLPENYVHGMPQYYATAMPARGSAVPLVVKSSDGRPTKIEGNALHPDSNGGTDRWAQASILNLYDPDRAMKFKRGGNVTTPEAAFGFLDELSKKAQGEGGKGLSFLVERSSSPSRQRLQKMIAEKLPQSRWYVYEPVDLGIKRRAASQAFGKSVKPYYHFDKAKVIVSLDCDFLGSEEDVHTSIRRFAQGRKMEKPEDSLNRLYVVESLFTLTGFNADHRLRFPSSAVMVVANALAKKIPLTVAGPDGNRERIGEVDPWIEECAKDLVANKGQSLVVAGYRQPMIVHLLANAMNVALGNVGKTVVFHEVPEAKEGTIGELAKALSGGEVETLVMLGGNPVYSAPADLDWAKTQREAKTVVRLGYYEDETSVDCDWHLPMTHYLESWGDARTSDGTLVPIQPLISPLFGGVTELEVLARILGSNTTSAYEFVRETFAGFIGGGDVEAAWRKFLHDGFLANSDSKPVEAALNREAVTKAVGESIMPGRPGSLEVVFFRDYSVDDGRYNNNGWLQELPDPITKMVWDNAVLISRKTAKELGVQNSDVVEIKIGNRSVRGPIWVQPGLADGSLGLALGYGREKTGRVGRGTGFNVYPLRTSEAENFAVGATLTKTGETYTLACTQDHWSLEGRPIIREANLREIRMLPKFREGDESGSAAGGGAAVSQSVR